MPVGHDNSRSTLCDGPAEPNHAVLPLLLLFLVAVVAIPLRPVLDARALSFDDNEYLTENPLVQSPGLRSAGRFLTEVFEPSTVDGYYQPLAMISLMMDYAAGGRPNDLRPFHRTELLLHVLNTVLLAILLYVLFGEPVTAVLLATLFGLHPSTGECLAWIAQRKTRLATFFALSCLITYVGYTRTKRKSFYGASLTTFVLALMSKPTAVPLAFVLLLFDWWPLRRFGRGTSAGTSTGKEVSFRAALLEKAPYFFIGALFAVITYVSQTRTIGTVPPSDAPWTHVPLLLGFTIALYLRNLLWPVGFPVYYGFPEPFSWSNASVVLYVLVSCVAVAIVALLGRRGRRWQSGGLIFFVLIFPALGIIGFTNVVAANRFLYLPMFGLLLPIADLAAPAWRRARSNARAAPRIAMTSVAIVIIALLAVETRRALVPWRDTVSLFQHLATSAPNAPDVRYNLGNALDDAGDRAGAADEYRITIVLEPRHSPAHNNLAVLLTEEGRLEEAIEHYESALRFMSRNTNALNSYGAALIKLGRVNEAIARFREAIRLKPDFAAARFNLGCALVDLGQFDEAAHEFRAVINLDPDEADAHAFLGHCLEQLGHRDEAIGHYQNALAINPNHADAKERVQALTLQPSRNP